MPSYLCATWGWVNGWERPPPHHPVRGCRLAVIPEDPILLPHPVSAPSLLGPQRHGAQASLSSAPSVWLGCVAHGPGRACEHTSAGGRSPVVSDAHTSTAPHTCAGEHTRPVRCLRTWRGTRPTPLGKAGPWLSCWPPGPTMIMLYIPGLVLRPLSSQCD